MQAWEARAGCSWQESHIMIVNGKNGSNIRERTYKFGLNAISLIRKVTLKDMVIRELSRQLVRAATLVFAAGVLMV